MVGAVMSWGAPLQVQGDLTSDSGETARIGMFILVIGGWVISLCLHEFTHAYLAHRAGDHTISQRGYLTLNPLKYSHWLLSILLPLVFIISGGIGLPGGAVYLHPHVFKTKLQRSMASFCGPLTNLVIGAILLVGLRVIQPNEHYFFWSAIAVIGWFQITAALLNLLPIPGLDGYGTIEPYLSVETQRALEPFKQWGMIGLFLVLYSARNINAAFFNLVDHVYNWTGAPYLYFHDGYVLFRFWKHLV